MKLNPRVKDFLEENPNVSLLGLYWAGYWRFVVVLYGSILLIAIFLAGIGALLGN